MIQSNVRNKHFMNSHNVYIVNGAINDLYQKSARFSKLYFFHNNYYVVLGYYLIGLTEEVIGNMFR